MASRAVTAPRLCLAGIVILAVALRGWGLEEGGFVTPYYFAGVRSMMQSWHNFFFNAFDPAGFLSLDKPPVAFWFQAISAKLFGFDAWSVLLPQVLEGVAAVVVLYLLVARRFGAVAGLLAALFLALDPVSVAVGRSNGTDACLVLVLLLAAWVLDRAIATGSRRVLVGAAALLGLGFNVKMLAAVGVVPVFVALYLIAGPPAWLRRLVDVALAGLVFVCVSLSWCIAFDLTAPDRRPFADSSADNSMLELAVGHNGLDRFVLPARALARGAPSADPAQPDQPPVIQRLRSVDYVPVGVFRLAGPHLAAQAGWLFPLALIGGVAAWLRRPLRSPVRVQLALWSGWAAAYGIVFSAADGFFHPHYLSLMAPPICALAGIGLTRLWSDFAAGRGGAWGLPLALLATAAWQAHILLGYFPNWADRLAIGVVGIAVLFAAGAALAWRRSDWRLFAAGVVGSALPLLLAAPAGWALGAILATDNTAFASARPPFATPDEETARLRWAARWGGFVHRPKLTEYLMQNRGEARFLVATLNARQAAPVIIDSGEPVLALGGFSGISPIVTQFALGEMIARGEVRFALIHRLQAGLIRQSQLAEWIRRNGEPVDPALWREESDRLGATVAQARMDRGAARALELYDLRKAASEGDLAPALAAP